MQSVQLLYCLLCLLLLQLADVKAIKYEDLIDPAATLPTFDYVDSIEFLDQLRKSSVPVLLKNTPAQLQWNAMKKWPHKAESGVAQYSLGYLSQTSFQRIGVKQYDKPKFSIGCCELVPMTQKEFWTAIGVLPEGQYMYLNAESSLLDKEIQNDLLPSFFEASHKIDPSIQNKRVITNIWMGSKGSTAALHHDPFDNFFVQIDGSKQFTLFSPDLHHSFYVHPKTHPASRQAQVNIDAPDEVKFPRVLEAVGKGIKLIVNPGDVLYLPPFWFHQVEALTTAISVNTWFNAPEVEIMDRAWEEQLPLSSDWSDEGFALGVKLILQGLIQKVLGDPDDTPEVAQSQVVRFMENLVDTRFAPLYGPAAIRNADLLAGISTVNDPHLRVHMREQAELDKEAFVSPEGVQDLNSICSIPASILFEEDPNWKQELELRIKSLARYFMAVEKDSGFQIMHLEDFVEDLIGQTVGDSNVYYYISECLLKSDSK